MISTIKKGIIIANYFLAIIPFSFYYENDNTIKYAKIALFRLGKATSAVSW